MIASNHNCDLNSDDNSEPETFFRVNKSKTIVYIDTEMMTTSQYKQIKCQDMKVSVSRIQIPKLKVKDLSSTLDSNREKALNCENVLNYINAINVSNCQSDDIHPKRPKRKLKSIAVKNDNNFNDKRSKMDYKESNEKTINVKIMSKEKKNKENKNVCSPSLSRVIGLPNMGNTCYINSIIQVLRMTPGFRQFVCSLNSGIGSLKNGFKLKISNIQLISSLHNIFVHFGNNEVKAKSNSLSMNESKITDLIDCEAIKNRFEFGQQQDCHEFLNWLIDQLNTSGEIMFKTYGLTTNTTKTYNTRRKSLDSNQSMSFKSFEGVMVRNIMCSECKKNSSTYDSFADIQIPLCINEEVADIPKKQTFADIIHRKDFLKDDNKFDCRNCSKKTNASVLNCIETPPKVLIIFIKKPFEYNQMNTRNGKPLKNLFNAPLKLEYSSSHSKNAVRYSLYAFVMHSGSDIDNGHYYAMIDSGPTNPKKCKNQKFDCNCLLNVAPNNGWIKVNDHKVTKLDFPYVKRLLTNQFTSSTPYLAFYNKID